MKHDIQIVIDREGHITIEGVELAGDGAKEVHDLIDRITGNLMKDTSQYCKTEPNRFVDPIKVEVRR